MGRYLVLWKMDKSRLPVNPRERASGFNALISIVKQSMEMANVRDWGAFAGEGRGYVIIEGTELELELQLQQYVPLVDFKIHPLLSLNQVEEMIAAMSR